MRTVVLMLTISLLGLVGCHELGDKDTARTRNNGVGSLFNCAM